MVRPRPTAAAGDAVSARANGVGASANRSASAVGGGLIPRRELFLTLERGTEHPLTVLTAGPGSGKTVLVRSWLQSRDRARRAAWVSVERGEREAQRFWRTVIGELRSVGPDVAAVGELEPTPNFDGRAVVERLVSELASLRRQVVLVIDDVHELASVDAQDGLRYFLDHLPAPVHVVLITRHDRQLGLQRRRLSGQLTEIRSADLRFTEEETAAMLAASGVTLSPAGVKLLHERTEGWVAAVRLAAISLVGASDPEGFVVQFSGSERTIAEYLFGEVLESQTPDVRRLLVRASLLERVNGELGDLLTGRSGTERDLQELADASGFVVALDAARTWFRFHHLFADLLAVELRNTESEEMPRLHAAAAKWFAAHGNFVEAITHAQAAGDRGMAAELLVEHYFSLTLDGRQAAAAAIIEAFPPDPIGADPELAVVVAAEQLVTGSLDQAATHLAFAERHADAVPAYRRHRFESALLVTRLSLARRLGDFRSVLEEVSAATRTAESWNIRDIAMHNDVRLLGLVNLGIVEAWSGRPEDAVEHLERARGLAEQIGRPYLVVTCQAHLAFAIAERSFTRSREASREAIALAERHGWGSDPVIAPALVTMAASLLQAGRLHDAEQWLVRTDETLRPDLEPAIGFLLHLAWGGLRFAQGRSSEAIDCFRAAERRGLLLVAGSPLARQLGSATLRAMLDVGEVTAVRNGLTALSEDDRNAGEYREILAMLEFADGNAEAALGVLAPTLDGSAPVHRSVVVVRSLIHAALAHDAVGDTRAAEDAVERALDLAEEDELILPFAHTPSRELLARHPRHRTRHGALIADILDVMTERAPEAEPNRVALDAESLSAAELRVLSYLPTNLPAAGIASEIYLSVHTVKTHMRHIYAKLGAHSRVDAVERAREFGLIGRSSRHG